MFRLGSTFIVDKVWPRSGRRRLSSEASGCVFDCAIISSKWRGSGRSVTHGERDSISGGGGKAGIHTMRWVDPTGGRIAHNNYRMVNGRASVTQRDVA